MTEYDFIIIGAGAAGLMLAAGMGEDPAFKDKKILLLDKDSKTTNDRTWCFWEKGKGAFAGIIHRKWDRVLFTGDHSRNSLDISPYSYKMVRGIDFYSLFMKRVESCPNITFRQEMVTDLAQSADGVAVVQTEGNRYRTRQVFNSRFSHNSILTEPKYPVLQQHFIGWFIRTKRSVFDPDQPTFMDFSVPQKGNTRFMYVLPFSENEALVEYTLFSPDLLEDQEYEKAIQEYMIREYAEADYEVTEKEKGSIPMTCYDFSQHNTQNIFHIGTAGGWSKPSTGYTFLNTAKKTDALIQHLKAQKTLASFQKKNRFWYYDLLLLNILYRNNELGASIFESLFRKRSPQLIFKFLDEETRWYEDIRIMMAPNPVPFLQALGRHIFWVITGKKKQW